MSARGWFMVVLATALSLLAGCSTAPKGMDYTAFIAARPASIVVLPPLNESPDVNATPSVLAQSTAPLAESGYYVVPVGVMMEAFRQNGLTEPHDIHEVSRSKLRQIFGADAALYITVTDYGTQYTVFDSVARVSARAVLVDLRSGQTLWSGSATAHNNEGRNNSNQGLLGAVIGAVVRQVINAVTDAAHPVAGITANRLLHAGRQDGILWGPRAPLYGQDTPAPLR